MGTEKIQRSNIDGSSVEDIVTTGLTRPRGIALDVSGGKMYWVDQGTDKIQRSNLDGSGVEDLVTTGLRKPQGIALDVSGGKMYWADYGEWERRHEDKIRSSGPTSTAAASKPSSPRDSLDPWGIALDVAGGKMYWTDAFDRIQRSNLDGSNVENIVTGLYSPRGIALGFARVVAGQGSVVPASATGTP